MQKDTDDGQTAIATHRSVTALPVWSSKKSLNRSATNVL